jgi:polyribonucleotide nucleotidyltransferase
MSSVVELELNNKKEIYEIDKVARQANGAVLLREKDAVILATVTFDEEPVEEDFLPLTVQYVEKAYAAAKIPGGFIKRESRPSDFETLTSRIIDRSLRPLFPKGFNYPTQVTVLVLSGDFSVDLQTMATNAASIALYISDLPIDYPLSSVRVAKIDETLILNPSNKELKDSSLDLLVSGVKEDLLMIEMMVNSLDDRDMNELSDEEVLDALEFANEAITKASGIYKESFAKFKKEIVDLELKDSVEDVEVYEYVKSNFKDDLYQAINSMAKSERAGELNKIVKKILAKHPDFDEEAVKNSVDRFKREIVRGMILKERKRADGRGLEDVRAIEIETNILPSVHSSALFRRGETQVLVALTLGGAKDAQSYDTLSSKETQYENFMVHYNFPGFSVGEASMLKAPGRRELGHGNLAKRALLPSINLDKNETVRLVSEVLESNGSSSMATVCGGSLALKAANLEVKKLVAGVAMGLVVEGDNYAILTDIMGLEDHDGDMDFKVAGTREGITALQMDIKLGGVDKEILSNALSQAKKARAHILDIMEEASSKIELNQNALPSKSVFDLDPSTFGAIIGQAGKNIKEIIEKFEVSIDLNRDKGVVKIEGNSQESVDAATKHIKEVANSESSRRGRDSKPIPEFREGQVFDGEVKRVADFGAFVELPGGVDGLLHISKLSDVRVDKVTDIVDVGDMLKVKILSQNGKKIELGLIEKL